MHLAGAILTVVGGAILFLVIVCVENPRMTASWFVVGGSILLWILLLRAICAGINDSDMSDSLQTILKIIVICVGMGVGVFLFAKLCNDGVDNIVTGGLLKNEVEKEQFKNEIRKTYGNIPEEDLNLLWSSYGSPILTSKKLRPTTKECYEFLFTLKLRELKELSDAELEERLGYAFRMIPLSSYLTRLDATTERKQCAQMFVLKKHGYSVTPLGCFLMVYRPGIREHNYPKTFQKYMNEHPEYNGITSCGAQDPTIIFQLRDFYTSIPTNELSRLVTLAVKQGGEKSSVWKLDGLIRNIKWQEIHALEDGEIEILLGYAYTAIPIQLLESCCNVVHCEEIALRCRRYCAILKVLKKHGFYSPNFVWGEDKFRALFNECNQQSSYIYEQTFDQFMADNPQFIIH